MWFGKPNVQKMAARDQFDASLRVLNGKDEQLAREAIPAVASLVLDPLRAKSASGGQRMEEGRIRLARLAVSPAGQRPEVLLGLLQGGVSDEKNYPIVDMLLKVGGKERLFAALDERSIKKSARHSTCNSLLRIAVESKDGTLAIDVIRRLDGSDDDWVIVTLLGIGEFDIASVIVAANPSEKDIVTFLGKSRSGRAACVLCDVLTELGSEQALDTLSRVPRFPKPPLSDRPPTTSAARVAIHRIMDRMEKSSVETLTRSENKVLRAQAKIKLARKAACQQKEPTEKTCYIMVDDGKLCYFTSAPGMSEGSVPLANLNQETVQRAVEQLKREMTGRSHVSTFVLVTDETDWN
jgi:hypothetical protein